MHSDSSCAEGRDLARRHRLKTHEIRAILGKMVDAETLFVLDPEKHAYAFDAQPMRPPQVQLRKKRKRDELKANANGDSRESESDGSDAKESGSIEKIKNRRKVVIHGKIILKSPKSSKTQCTH